VRRIFQAALLGAAVIFTGVNLAGGAEAAQTDDSGVSGQYIVVLDDSVNSSVVSNDHARRHGVEVLGVYQHALRGYAARMSGAAAANIARAPGVRWVELDRPATATAQTLPTGIDRVDADISATAGIDGVDTRVDVDVAIIDSGIELTHPDLNVYLPGAKNCSKPPASANDGFGHGTHVAGTVGALDNDLGVVGVAPGARLWPVRVLNNLGQGSLSTVICGVDFVTAHASEIEVANMSLGFKGSDDGNCGYTMRDALHKAICASVAAGVTYVASAGNDHVDVSGAVPAAYDEVITVSGLIDFDGLPGGVGTPTCAPAQDDTFAFLSNYGLDVDLIAPGACILSTVIGGGYGINSGTSMSAPHVTGGAALYAATRPDATPGQIKAALQDAGTTDYDPVGDLDGVQERLLNVSTF
jgi:subtilisin